MSSQTRRQNILKFLDTTHEADIHTLATKLNVSEITIRRDLISLAADGMLYRTHGGATKVDPVINSSSFHNKAAVNIKAKDDICRKAAEEIMDGDIIFMDCGSTVFRLCQFIKQKKIKVITNSIPVVVELNDSSVSINLVGGEVDSKRQAIHGRIAEEHINRYKASKAFLGVDGISENGLFANSELEASNTLAMMAQSKTCYILCDETKIEKEAYLKFADIDRLNVLITNAEECKLSFFSKKGICVVKVN